MASYFKIFNEVFTNERAATVQRYYLTEVKVVELTEHALTKESDMTECYSFNFL
jgi:hypothetical protein